MRNVDRIIRVLYTEADLADLATWNFGPLYDDTYLKNEMGQLLNAEFYIEDDCYPSMNSSLSQKYWQAVVERYMHLYPRDYNDNEVGIILDAAAKKAKERFGLGLVNAAYLLPLCAGKMLFQQGNTFYVKQDYLLEWEGLINKIDPDALFASYNAFYSYENQPCISAKQSDTRLTKILSKGFSENHAHLKGSGYTSEISWFCYLYLFHNNKAKCFKTLEDVIAAKWRDKDAIFQERLLLSFKKIPVLRAILEVRTRLLGGSIPIVSEGEGDSDSLSCSELDRMLRQLFLVQDEITLDLLLSKDEFMGVLACQDDLIGDKLPESTFEYFRFEQDFLYKVFSLLKRGLLSAEALFALNVYLVASTQLKACMIQDNLNMGFKRFARAQDQKEVFIDHVPRGTDAIYDSVFEKYYRCGGIEFAELRIGPKPGMKGALLSTVKKLKRANERVYERLRAQDKDIAKIDFGLIIHFIKGEEPPNTTLGCSRKEFLTEKHKKQWLELEAVFDMSSDSDDFLKKVVAIDAANFEITTRPEVYGPIFRAFTKTVSTRFDTGITYHAGEDFLTLANGLRAMDEAVDYLGMREGDRIGHGTALGLSAKDYFGEKRSFVTNSLQEHVDDLAWMHKVISGGSRIRPEILAFLKREYEAYATDLFESVDYPAPPIERYQLSMELRGNDPEWLLMDEVECTPFDRFDTKRTCTEAAERANRSQEARDLYCLYCYDSEYKRRGSKPLVIEVEPIYIEAVEAAQAILRDKIHVKRISIEANPSSNRKISYVNRFIDLQWLRLNHHGLTVPETLDMPAGPDIPITISTDDSGVFLTDPALEYAYISAALKREGFDSEEIYPYIDYLRELSLQQNYVCKKLR